YGTFFLHKIGSIISIGDLPTTNIIEPKKLPETGTHDSAGLVVAGLMATLAAYGLTKRKED
ncbi:LPXTG cell wall anchor domain-containing protein, partial [Streptococcus pneumoniae]|nr:LPXTG cell wall anchor domain-containing protein [Streptococcus pneumoniae]